MSNRDCYCGHGEHQHTTTHKADGSTTGMACLLCFKEKGMCFDRSFMGSAWDLSIKLQELWRAICDHDKDFSTEIIHIVTDSRRNNDN